MADEYIRREDAMWAVCKALCHPGVRCPDNYCIEVRKVFNAIPAADVRPVVYAHWEIANKTYDEDGMARWRCSNCKNYRWFGKKPTHIKFCEECGAAMREVQDDD